MIKVDWQVIPHQKQRYDSSGDWYWNEEGTTLHIRISRLGDPRYEFCLGLHELVEAMLCSFAHVSQKTVDEFDMPYEKAHQRKDPHYPCGCPRERFSDPGSDRHAPYKFQHQVADVVERVVAAVLDINWKDYDALVDCPLL